MKRLVGFRLDPLPRFISTKSLSLLVAMLLLGIGISVREYLESRRAPERAVPASSPEILGGCTHGESCTPSASKPSLETGPAEPASETGARIPTVKSRPATSVRTAAPTEWVPETDAPTGSSGGPPGAVWEL